MRTVWTGALAAAAVACGGPAPTPEADGAQAAPAPEAEAPVALNADVPIAYPVALFEQKVEGDVVLRLFVDSTGRLVPESTRVAESSNYPALDSAAVAGSGQLRFAPAKRRGVAVATAFLQPVEFRHPGGTPAGPPPPGAQTTTRVTAPPPSPPTIPVTPAPRPPVAVPQVVVPPSRPQARPDSVRPPRDTSRDTTTDTTRAVRDTSGSASAP